jgi:hypothetical protein
MEALCNLFGGQENFGIWDAVHGDSFNLGLSVLDRIGVKYRDLSSVWQYLRGLLVSLN